MCLIYTMHTKVANPLGKPKKQKKTKAPSQKHIKTIEKTKKKQKNQRSEQLWGWCGAGCRSSCLGQPLSYYRVFFVCSYHTYKKTRDNKREAGPDMSSSPPPIVAQIFGFFCFFLAFSMVLLCFWEGAFGFFGFFGFPNGFAIFVCKAMDDIHHRREWYDTHKLLFS